MIKTIVNFDLSKIRNLSPEESFNKLTSACYREITKMSFSTQPNRRCEIVLQGMGEDIRSIPQALQVLIYSPEPLNYLNKEMLLKQMEAHTMVPVTYQIEEGVNYELDCVELFLERLEEFKKEVDKNVSSNPNFANEFKEQEERYVAEIVNELSVGKPSDMMNASQLFKNIRRLKNVLKSEDNPKDYLTLDQRIQKFLNDSELIALIKSKHDFLYEVIQAYQQQALETICPESWPSQSILTLVRQGTFKEINLFSMFCMKLQENKSQGRLIQNDLNATLQPEPLHIGLFDIYREYLNTLSNILDRLSQKNPYRDQCIDLFEAIKYALNNFIQDQENNICKRDALRQKAWINVLLKIKNTFQWIEKINLSQEELDAYYRLDWNSVELLSGIGGYQRYDYREYMDTSELYKRISECFDLNAEESLNKFSMLPEDMAVRSYLLNESKISKEEAHRQFSQFTQNQILTILAYKLSEARSASVEDPETVDRIVELLFSKKSPLNAGVKNVFDVHEYMKEIEKEVASNIYSFPKKSSYPGLIEHMSKKGQSEVSGVGCHWELSEELSERDLAILTYTSLTPMGHFMPQYSFHDGYFYSSFFLHMHDAYHEARYTNTYQRMGYDPSRTSEDRYQNLDNAEDYLYLMHRMLTLSEQSQEMRDIDKRYMSLYLFMNHEIETGDLDVLDIKNTSLFKLCGPSRIVFMQDLFVSLGIRVDFKRARNSVVIPGEYDFKELDEQSYPKYQRIKRDTFVAYINENLLMDAN